MLDARKFYIRHREAYPETSMQDSAMRGFFAQGVECAPFYGFGDVERMNDLGPEVGVAGYVVDVWRALDRIGRPRPEPIDYPEKLRPLLRREVWRGTLDDVTRSISRVFVKPVEHKLFTGFVWLGGEETRGGYESRRRVANIAGDTPVWISEVRDMRAEFRAMVLDGELKDVRRYKGDWWLAPDQWVIENAVNARAVDSRAYCLDFAVLSDDETVLVEANDGFAFGHYGLRDEIYARMLAARWNQLAGGS